MQNANITWNSLKKTFFCSTRLPIIWNLKTTFYVIYDKFLRKIIKFNDVENRLQQKKIIPHTMCHGSGTVSKAQE